MRYDSKQIVLEFYKKTGKTHHRMYTKGNLNTATKYISFCRNHVLKPFEYMDFLFKHWIPKCDNKYMNNLISLKALDYYFKNNLNTIPDNKVSFMDIIEGDKYILKLICPEFKKLRNVKGFLYDQGFLRRGGKPQNKLRMGSTV